MRKCLEKRQLRALADSLGYYLIYLCVPAVCILVGMMFRKVDVPVDRFMDESGDFYTVLGFGLAIYYLYRRCRKRGKDFLEEAMVFPSGMEPAAAVLLAAAGFGISMALSSIITILPFPAGFAASYGYETERLFYGPDQILVFLSVLFLAPVAEEILFRGFIMFRLERDFTKQQAVILSSIMFAVLHLHPLWMAYAFGMACLMGLAASRTENVCSSIAIHMGFNMASIPLMWINRCEAAREALFSSRLLVAAYGLAGGVLALAMFRLLKKKEDGKWLRN